MMEMKIITLIVWSCMTEYNNTDCYMLLLDASKAFDRIEYASLFNQLRSRNMFPVTLRLIMNMSISQKMQVRFDNTLSNQFTVGNGVKQGEGLSPILFTVYIDIVINNLKQMNVGCKIGSKFL